MFLPNRLERNGDRPERSAKGFSLLGGWCATEADFEACRDGGVEVRAECRDESGLRALWHESGARGLCG